jgi:putative transposase
VTRSGRRWRTILPIIVEAEAVEPVEPTPYRPGRPRRDGLDDKIIAMYARGMSVRDIRGHLEELYGLEVFPK